MRNLVSNIWFLILKSLVKWELDFFVLLLLVFFCWFISSGVVLLFGVMVVNVVYCDYFKSGVKEGRWGFDFWSWVGCDNELEG